MLIIVCLCLRMCVSVDCCLLCLVVCCLLLLVVSLMMVCCWVLLVVRSCLWRGAVSRSVLFVVHRSLFVVRSWVGRCVLFVVCCCVLVLRLLVVCC